MNFDFYKFGKRIDLFRKYNYIELAFIDIFKGLLIDDKYVAEDFQLYTLQYHKDYNWLNDGGSCFLTVLLEASSRQLQISQIMSNSDINLDYDINDSIFFGRMIGDFLIRNKNISVVVHDEKKVITSCDDYKNYFSDMLNIDNSYKILRPAPIEFGFRDNKTQKFKRKTFSYRSQDYIYNPNDMCSYLGGHLIKQNVFVKKNN